MVTGLLERAVASSQLAVENIAEAKTVEAMVRNKSWSFGVTEEREDLVCHWQPRNRAERRFEQEEEEAVRAWAATEPWYWRLSCQMGCEGRSHNPVRRALWRSSERSLTLDSLLAPSMPDCVALTSRVLIDEQDASWGNKSVV